MNDYNLAKIIKNALVGNNAPEQVSKLLFLYSLSDIEVENVYTKVNAKTGPMEDDIIHLNNLKSFGDWVNDTNVNISELDKYEIDNVHIELMNVIRNADEGIINAIIDNRLILQQFRSVFKKQYEIDLLNQKYDDLNNQTLSNVYESNRVRISELERERDDIINQIQNIHLLHNDSNSGIDEVLLKLQKNYDEKFNEFKKYQDIIQDNEFLAKGISYEIKNKKTINNVISDEYRIKHAELERLKKILQNNNDDSLKTVLINEVKRLDVEVEKIEQVISKTHELHNKWIVPSVSLHEIDINLEQVRNLIAEKQELQARVQTKAQLLENAQLFQEKLNKFSDNEILALFKSIDSDHLIPQDEDTSHMNENAQNALLKLRYLRNKNNESEQKIINIVESELNNSAANAQKLLQNQIFHLKKDIDHIALEQQKSITDQINNEIFNIKHALINNNLNVQNDVIETIKAKIESYDSQLAECDKNLLLQTEKCKEYSVSMSAEDLAKLSGLIAEFQDQSSFQINEDNLNITYNNLLKQIKGLGAFKTTINQINPKLHHSQSNVFLDQLSEYNKLPTPSSKSKAKYSRGLSTPISDDNTLISKEVNKLNASNQNNTKLQKALEEVGLNKNTPILEIKDALRRLEYKKHIDKIDNGIHKLITPYGLSKEKAIYQIESYKTYQDITKQINQINEDIQELYTAKEQLSSELKSREDEQLLYIKTEKTRQDELEKRIKFLRSSEYRKELERNGAEEIELKGKEIDVCTAFSEVFIENDYSDSKLLSLMDKITKLKVYKLDLIEQEILELEHYQVDKQLEIEETEQDSVEHKELVELLELNQQILDECNLQKQKLYNGLSIVQKLYDDDVYNLSSVKLEEKRKAFLVLLSKNSDILDSASLQEAYNYASNRSKYHELINAIQLSDANRMHEIIKHIYTDVALKRTLETYTNRHLVAKQRNHVAISELESIYKYFNVQEELSAYSDISPNNKHELDVRYQELATELPVLQNTRTNLLELRNNFQNLEKINAIINNAKHHKQAVSNVLYNVQNEIDTIQDLSKRFISNNRELNQRQNALINGEFLFKDVELDKGHIIKSEINALHISLEQEMLELKQLVETTINTQQQLEQEKQMGFNKFKVKASTEKIYSKEDFEAIEIQQANAYTTYAQQIISSFDDKINESPEAKILKELFVDEATLSTKKLEIASENRAIVIQKLTEETNVNGLNQAITADANTFVLSDDKDSILNEIMQLQDDDVGDIQSQWYREWAERIAKIKTLLGFKTKLPEHQFSEDIQAVKDDIDESIKNLVKKQDVDVQNIQENAKKLRDAASRKETHLNNVGTTYQNINIHQIAQAAIKIGNDGTELPLVLAVDLKLPIPNPSHVTSLQVLQKAVDDKHLLTIDKTVNVHRNFKAAVEGEISKILNKDNIANYVNTEEPFKALQEKLELLTKQQIHDADISQCQSFDAVDLVLRKQKLINDLRKHQQKIPAKLRDNKAVVPVVQEIENKIQAIQQNVNVPVDDKDAKRIENNVELIAQKNEEHQAVIKALEEEYNEAIDINAIKKKLEKLNFLKVAHGNKENVINIGDDQKVENQFEQTKTQDDVVDILNATKHESIKKTLKNIQEFSKDEVLKTLGEKVKSDVNKLVDDYIKPTGKSEDFQTNLHTINSDIKAIKAVHNNISESINSTTLDDEDKETLKSHVIAQFSEALNGDTISDIKSNSDKMSEKLKSGIKNVDTFTKLNNAIVILGNDNIEKRNVKSIYDNENFDNDIDTVVEAQKIALAEERQKKIEALNTAFDANNVDEIKAVQLKELYNTNVNQINGNAINNNDPINIGLVEEYNNRLQAIRAIDIAKVAEQIQEHSATKIQSHVRGLAAKKTLFKLKTERTAAVKIQSFIRQKKDQQEFKKTKEGVIKVQSLVRRYNAKKDLQHLKNEDKNYLQAIHTLKEQLLAAKVPEEHSTTFVESFGKDKNDVTEKINVLLQDDNTELNRIVGLYNEASQTNDAIQTFGRISNIQMDAMAFNLQDIYTNHEYSNINSINILKTKQNEYLEQFKNQSIELITKTISDDDLQESRDRYIKLINDYKFDDNDSLQNRNKLCKQIKDKHKEILEQIKVEVANAQAITKQLKGMSQENKQKLLKLKPEEQKQFVEDYKRALELKNNIDVFSKQFANTSYKNQVTLIANKFVDLDKTDSFFKKWSSGIGRSFLKNQVSSFILDQTQFFDQVKGDKLTILNRYGDNIQNILIASKQTEYQNNVTEYRKKIDACKIADKASSNNILFAQILGYAKQIDILGRNIEKTTQQHALQKATLSSIIATNKIKDLRAQENLAIPNDPQTKEIVEKIGPDTVNIRPKIFGEISADFSDISKALDGKINDNSLSTKEQEFKAQIDVKNNETLGAVLKDTDPMSFIKREYISKVVLAYEQNKEYLNKGKDKERFQALSREIEELQTIDNIVKFQQFDFIRTINNLIKSQNYIAERVKAVGNFPGINEGYDAVSLEQLDSLNANAKKLHLATKGMKKILSAKIQNAMKQAAYQKIASEVLAKSKQDAKANGVVINIDNLDHIKGEEKIIRKLTLPFPDPKTKEIKEYTISFELRGQNAIGYSIKEVSQIQSLELESQAKILDTITHALEVGKNQSMNIKYKDDDGSEKTIDYIAEVLGDDKSTKDLFLMIPQYYAAAKKKGIDAKYKKLGLNTEVSDIKKIAAIYVDKDNSTNVVEKTRAEKELEKRGQKQKYIEKWGEENSNKHD